MTQFEPSDDDLVAHNTSPRVVHNTEQMWAQAQEHIGKIMTMLGEDLPEIMRQGGSNDPSTVFAFMFQYITRAEMLGGPAAHAMTVAMCATAITKLVLAPSTEEMNTVLAQLDKEFNSHDDDH